MWFSALLQGGGGPAGGAARTNSVAPGCARSKRRGVARK
jgi:hypothetical protein